MQPRYLPLSAIFGVETRHTVPLFQRPYVWDEENNWAPLWDDIAELSNRLLKGSTGRTVPGHFLGTVVLEQSPHSSGSVSRREVIDGQQRLTTLQILLHAAVHALEETREAAEASGDADGKSKTDVKARQLKALTTNPAYEEDEERYKVWPTNEDRSAFREVMDATDPCQLADKNTRLAATYRYFHGAISRWIGSGEDAPMRAVAVGNALKDHIRLIILDLDDTDEPQAIFETLNAHGTPLLPADLMKNWFLWTAPAQGHDGEKLYKEYWAEFDKEPDYWRKEVGTGHAARARVDTFLQNWLTRRTGEAVPTKHLYDRFLKFTAAKGGSEEENDVLHLMQDIHRDAMNFKIIEGPRAQTRFHDFLRRLKSMDVIVFHPVLLTLMNRGAAREKDLADAAVHLESYLVRRIICNQQTRGYGTLAIGMLPLITNTEADVAPIIERYLSAQERALQWPDDDMFKKAWTERAIYGSLRRQRIVMILQALEEWMQRGSLKSEPIVSFNFGNLQIEHIMPQDWHEHWPLGDVAEGYRDEWIDTIGNLTLLTERLNPSVSNAPWVAPAGKNQKRSALIEHSRLQLNSRLVTENTTSWDEQSIKQRAGELFEIARTIWPPPKPGYQKKNESPGSGVGRARLSSAGDNGEARIITVLVPSNPKKAGSASNERFSLYRSGMTIDEYKDACVKAGFTLGQARADLRWDIDHDFIEVK